MLRVAYLRIVAIAHTGEKLLRSILEEITSKVLSPLMNLMKNLEVPYALETWIGLKRIFPALQKEF